ncbi:MAG: type II toxin-antitoxin system death-on-curing family toxin [Christensenellaceae bacterium]|nr:type II toxin-antitoxin system death-on-curing family toxin [Christensenellaceae bacterium]
MIWTNAEQIIAIHSKVTGKTGGLDGLRDMSGLESALAAPMQTFGGEELFKTELEKIARLGFGLAANHAFIDGNKRIGAVMTQLLLKWNGYAPKLAVGELSDMFIGIAAGEKSEEDLLSWILVKCG